MSDSFVQRAIDVTFTLNSGSFGTAGADTVTLSGLRVGVDIASAGLEAGVVAHARIEGMTEQLMNRLSIASSNGLALPNSNMISIAAGDAQSGMTTVFQGGIFEAFIDFSGAPDVAFIASALTMLAPNAVPIAPTSFKGPIAVSQVLRTIAQKAGLAFYDGGLTQTLTNPYFWGCAGQQIATCTRAIRATWIIDKLTLYVWPQGAASSEPAILVSAATGLLGYPSYSQAGVQFDTIFNPALAFQAVVEVDSQYLPAGWTNLYGNRSPGGSANGMYTVAGLQHTLQSEIPDGPWISSVTGQTKVAGAPPVVAGR